MRSIIRTCFRTFALSMLVTISIAAAVSAATSADSSVRLPGHVVPALTRSTLIPEQPGRSQRGRVDREPIVLTIVLRRDDQEGFNQFLRDLYDSRSSEYRHYLTQPQIADRFGPSAADYNAVLDFTRA